MLTLDVACGWGEFLVNHATGARRVSGVDLAPAKVALARERLAERIRAGIAEVVVADAARHAGVHFTYDLKAQKED